jgi:acid phosphatase
MIKQPFAKALFSFVLLSQLVAFGPCQANTAAPRFKRVVYIVLENQDYRDVYKNANFKRWAEMGANLTNFFAQTHPSQPNYIAMIAGDTLGVNNNGNWALDGKHLGDLIEEKGLDWRTYAEGFPGNCFLGTTSGDYARRHVPFLSFKNIQNSPSRCSKVVGFESFVSDWRANKLTAFNMVIPNNKSNGHDTNIETAAQWIKKHFEPLMADASLMKDTLVVITYDEGSYVLKNQIYTVLIGPSVIPGSTNNDRHTHYSLIRLLEEEWGLNHLGRGDVSASSLLQIWQ